VCPEKRGRVQSENRCVHRGNPGKLPSAVHVSSHPVIITSPRLIVDCSRSVLPKVRYLIRISVVGTLGAVSCLFLSMG
jgi:hypothetical protein